MSLAVRTVSIQAQTERTGPIFRRERTRWPAAWAVWASTLIVFASLAPVMALSDRAFGASQLPSLTESTPMIESRPSSGMSTLSTTSPSARAFHSMAYDAESNRVIMFGGGLVVGQSAETWAYDFDSNTWSDRNPTVRPPARDSFGMAYDAESDRIVIFGGFDGANLGGFGDTWAYNYSSNTWTNMNPTTAPSARFGHCIAYDATSDQIIVVGGHFQTQTVGPILYRETWAYNYNLNRWTNVTGPGGPSKSNWCALAYDADSAEVVLFGGQGGGISDETWAYNYSSNTWTNLNPDPKPSARWFHAMAYDSLSDRTVLFGGESGQHLTDTWSYNLNTNTWTNTNPAAHPSGRSGLPMAYDAKSDRLVLFGGDLSGALSNETWVYDVDANTWTPLTLPSAPRNLQAVAGDGSVTLSWMPPSFSGGPSISNYRIYRGTTSGATSFLVEVGNVLTHADTAVSNGIQYFYRVAAVTIAGEGPPSNEEPATPTPEPDTINPTISIISPAQGAILGTATVEVSGTASDNVALSKAELSTDGTSWILATGTTSWSGTLTLNEGPNTIYARAVDTSGNTRNTNISVTVVLPPLPPPTPPPVLLIGGVAAGIAVAGIAIGFLFLRRKRAP